MNINEACRSAASNMRSGNLSQARDLYSLILRTQPEHPGALIGMGIILHKYGRLEQAADCYRKALSLRPEDETVRNSLAAVELEIQQINETIELLDIGSDAPVISFPEDNQENRDPTPHEINLAEAMFTRYGVLLIENAFPKHLLEGLQSYYRDRYARYFEDREFIDARHVGDRRNMFTVAIEGPFNDPRVYANNRVMPIMKRLLGDDCVLEGHGSVVSLPGSKMQALHRDSPLLFEDEAINRVTPCYAITFAIPLVPLNELNGTTRIYRGSHLKSNFSEQDIENYSEPDVDVGSCLLWDYRLLHQGTPNNSDEIRPLLYNAYHRCWYRDAYNYTKQLPVEIDDANFEKVPLELRSLFKFRPLKHT